MFLSYHGIFFFSVVTIASPFLEPSTHRFPYEKKNRANLAYTIDRRMRSDTRIYSERMESHRAMLYSPSRSACDSSPHRDRLWELPGVGHVRVKNFPGGFLAPRPRSRGRHPVLSGAKYRVRQYDGRRNRSSCREGISYCGNVISIHG